MIAVVTTDARYGFTVGGMSVPLVIVGVVYVADRRHAWVAAWRVRRAMFALSAAYAWREWWTWPLPATVQWPADPSPAPRHTRPLQSSLPEGASQ